LALPANARLDQTELGLRLSASLLGETEAAMQALLGYPYGCIEQTMSRLVPLVSAPAAAERLSGKPRAEQVRLVNARLAQFDLKARTGVPFWPGGRPDLFASAWTTLVLAASQAAQLPLDEGPLANARAGLERLMVEGKKGSGQMSDDLVALSLFALAEGGGSVPASWFEPFTANAGQGPPFAAAMAALALAKVQPQSQTPRSLLSALALRMQEEQATARVAELRDTLPVRSSTAAQAAVLWAFARLWPDHPVVSKLTTGLLDMRHGPAWDSTFEDALALLALSSLGVLREGHAAGSGALEVNDVPLLPATPLDSTGRPLLVTWPMVGPSAVPLSLGRSTVPITLHAGSESAIFYTLTLSYPAIDADAAATMGIRIATSYRTRYGELGSQEPLPVGEVFAIDLGLQSASKREHLAVTIPLPAGAEPFDLDLAHGASVIAPNLAPLRQIDVGAEELHRDHIMVFVRQLEAGLVRRYTVYARAAVPGRYLVPGAHAQAMYAPEIRGRAATRTIDVTVPER
jgi:uncharacterized protein YfaS (alpha-2-macroglobulin family)